ncbi:GNAT family N-acetyltransferase [Fusobacterium mortiferum]|jgi:ribosomal protein S18 acetylase RimI-like enzyme|uniref:N-acetyltransferase n=1 Tax=Fusobacterium mortiferum ATCC 9817 TaxID=469616 RepID=A0ABM6TUB7_FUSMR|nr:N-acetyltransferase [Fusobacterium mortiferum]AVQ18171.1 N-acetyltransferase [Fusobacterium mortiferum ATCC 9817]EEO36704.1 acetyltransferase, GNAT family [Fusobacterium mortiferum ATCC 9817]MCF2628471.1 GNAT family N-acetyltransferase [Fusobacterium mortiferum]MCF2700237.1 GNAT family N-acetyltransferase [Fusobacterium mortiferum]MCI7666520.1 GNAT family N-acetyltransferase [Fusobacterium mortiferum]
MEFRELHDVDLTLMNKIVEIEEEAFEGNGNVDLWILKALIRYGKVFVLVEGDEIITIAEYMQVLGKDEVFLYGISTRKKYRNRGNARKIMEESEKYLKRLGYKEVGLTVDPNNNIAMKLYKDLGYRIEEYQEDEYGKGIHRYLMKKVII